MPHFRIGAGGVVCALAGCVSTTSLNEEPRQDGRPQAEQGAQFGAPEWPSEVTWSYLPPGDGLLGGEWNGVPGLDLMVLGRGAEVAIRMEGLGDGRLENGQVLRTDPARLAEGAAQRGDVDGDGRDDFVYLSTLSSNDEPRTARITTLLQRELGFELRITPYEGGAAALALADVDDDGTLDALVAYGGSNTEPDALGYVRVLGGVGDGTFLPTTALATRIVGLSPRALTVRPNGTSGVEVAMVGVADGDTLVTAFAPRALALSPSIAITTATPTRPEVRVREPVRLPGEAESWTWADLDDDGRDDVVLGCAAERAYHVVLADARRLTLRIEDEAYALGANVAVGDVDGDGIRDLVIPASDTRDTSHEGYAFGPALLVLFGEGRATFSRRRVLQLARDDEFGERALVGDFDGDGQDDLGLLTARGDSPEARLGVLFGPYGSALPL